MTSWTSYTVFVKKHFFSPYFVAENVKKNKGKFDFISIRLKSVNTKKIFFTKNTLQLFVIDSSFL